jgi:hypothetical protein
MKAAADVLRRARGDATRCAAMLDALAATASSPNAQQSISKHLLSSLFRTLDASDAHASDRYMYVENHDSSCHFLHGLVVPLLARIMATACPGLLCIVQLPSDVSEIDHCPPNIDPRKQRIAGATGDSHRRQQHHLHFRGAGQQANESGLQREQDDGSESPDSTPSPLLLSAGPSASLSPTERVSDHARAAGSARAAGANVKQSQVHPDTHASGHAKASAKVLADAVAAAAASKNDSEHPAIPDKTRALRLICNGFEVLTGKVPISPMPKTSLTGAFTLASVAWQNAGIVTPARREHSVEMMFSNGMISVTDGIVVTFTNGSLCQLTIRDPIDVIEALDLPASSPVLLFAFTNSPGPTRLNRLMGMDESATQLTHRNVFAIEIGRDPKPPSTGGVNDDGDNRGDSPSTAETGLGSEIDSVLRPEATRSVGSPISSISSFRCLPLAADIIPNAVPLFVNTVAPPVSVPEDEYTEIGRGARASDVPKDVDAELCRQDQAEQQKHRAEDKATPPPQQRQSPRQRQQLDSEKKPKLPQVQAKQSRRQPQNEQQPMQIVQPHRHQPGRRQDHRDHHAHHDVHGHKQQEQNHSNYHDRYELQGQQKHEKDHERQYSHRELNGSRPDANRHLSGSQGTAAAGQASMAYSHSHHTQHQLHSQSMAAAMRPMYVSGGTLPMYPGYYYGHPPPPLQNPHHPNPCAESLQAVGLSSAGEATNDGGAADAAAAPTPVVATAPGTGLGIRRRDVDHAMRSMISPYYNGPPPPSSTAYHSHSHLHPHQYVMHPHQMASYPYPPNGYVSYPGVPGAGQTEMALHPPSHHYDMIPEMNPNGHPQLVQQRHAQFHHEQQQQHHQLLAEQQQQQYAHQQRQFALQEHQPPGTAPSSAGHLMTAAAAASEPPLTNRAGHTASSKLTDKADALEALVRMGDAAAKSGSSGGRSLSPAGSSDASGNSTSGVTGDNLSAGNSHKRARH